MATAVTEINAPIVRCKACELRQHAKATCRRCGKQLPAPERDVETQEKIVRERIERACPKCGLFADEAKLPTLAEAEEMLIQEAMKRANGQPSEASRLLGIGRTTLYRRLHPGQNQDDNDAGAMA
jgi:transcriptional regulator of acetoin/glycerol metabolism